MLAVISPAKTLDYENACPSHRSTQPGFLDESESLITLLRKKSRPQLREMMGISEKLADLNHERYREWSRPFNDDNARAALLAFKGDVYTGFNLDSYRKADFAFAQKHLRILSGLYGVLRPLDLMQAYRLEMGTTLKTPQGKSLYDFWGSKLTQSINRALNSSGSDVLVNLASKEYFSALQPSAIEGEVITPNFKDLKNGNYKIISFYAKKARGLMCDFMIRNEISDPMVLKKFKCEGYRFNRSLSEGNQWVFTRDTAPTA
tara:strand:- start:1748 stop:2530 length:783 start_codon:yes stop_codon:yes gene_type:complete